MFCVEFCEGISGGYCNTGMLESCVFDFLSSLLSEIVRVWIVLWLCLFFIMNKLNFFEKKFGGFGIVVYLCGVVFKEVSLYNIPF